MGTLSTRNLMLLLEEITYIIIDIHFKIFMYGVVINYIYVAMINKET